MTSPHSEQPRPTVLDHYRVVAAPRWLDPAGGPCQLSTIEPTASEEGYVKVYVPDYAPRFTGRRCPVWLHRLAYEHSHGPIPVGHSIDHLCGRRPCMNPRHLRAVPVTVNARRRTPTQDDMLPGMDSLLTPCRAPPRGCSP